MSISSRFITKTNWWSAVQEGRRWAEATVIFSRSRRRTGPSVWNFLRLFLVAFLAAFVAGNLARAQSRFFRTNPQSQFVQLGQTVTLSVSQGGGPAALQWQKNGVPLPGATASSLTLTIASIADAGNYAVVASDAFGSETSAPASLYMSRIANFSVRATVGPASPSVTLGHTVDGRGSAMLLRAVGPTLGQFGVRDALGDPRLTVARTLPVISNTGWSTAPNASLIAAEGGRLGAFPLLPGSADAALLSSVEGRVFSTEVTSASNATGTILAELYHADTATTNRLVNVSARARIASRDDRITAGFVLVGAVRTALLIRAVGPSLAAFGVGGALADPKLELFRVGAEEALVTNDSWAGTAELVAKSAAVGAFPQAGPDSRDAAVLVTLDPGGYCVQVTGVNGAVGETLIEIYVVP